MMLDEMECVMGTAEMQIAFLLPTPPPRGLSTSPPGGQLDIPQFFLALSLSVYFSCS